MDAIKLIGTSHKGILTVDVPEEYDGKELEIMIISSREIKKTGQAINEKESKDKEFLNKEGSKEH